MNNLQIPLNLFMTISIKNYKTLLLILLFLLQIATVTLSEVNALDTGERKKSKSDEKIEYIVKSEYGSINWTTGVVRAKGRNAPPIHNKDIITDAVLIELATENAREHLFEILKSIGLVSNKLASEKKEFEKQPEYATIAQIKKTSFGAKMVKSHYVSVLGQIVEVEVEAKIYGDFLDAVLPPEIGEIPDIELFDLEGRYFSSAKEHNLKDNNLDKREKLKADLKSHLPQKFPYTGLVIDARGIKFKPVICPVILSEQGEEIYSPQFISRKYAVERGICSYISDTEPLTISQKAGNKPATIKALRKDSDNNRSIIISMSDADRIQKMAERHIFMKGCRVVIVVSK